MLDSDYHLFMKTCFKTAGYAVALVVLSIGCSYLLLASPLTRDLRVRVASEFLSSALGQPVFVQGDAAIRLFPSPALVAAQMRVPSKEIEGIDLAQLEHARLALDPLRFFRGGVVFPEIEARGLRVTLIRSEDGRTSWTAITGQPRAVPGKEDTSLVGFLGARRVKFSSMRLNAENRATGFQFAFDLHGFEVQQQDTAVNVISHGSLNGQKFEASGIFPNKEAFQITGSAGVLSFSFAGAVPDGTGPGSFDGNLQVQTPDLQEFLRALKLKGDINGSGELSARLYRRGGSIDFEDVALNLALSGGQRAALTGRLSNPRKGPDFDLELTFDRFATSRPPEKAAFLRDTEFTGLELHAVGDGEEIEVERVILNTNAFDEEFRHIGPFEIDRIRRTPDGRLELSGLTLLLGPTEDPFLTATGQVANLLEMEGYSLAGALDLPADRVLLTLRKEEAERFGRLTGILKLAEMQGRAVLKEFVLKSEGSGLWNGEFSAAARNLKPLDGLSLGIRLGAPDGADFLEALRLEPVDLGPFDAEISLQRSRTALKAKAGLLFGGTSLRSDLILRVRQGAPVLRGALRSERIRLKDLQDGFLAALQIGRAQSVWEGIRLAEAGLASMDTSGFQPLVLPAEAEPSETGISGFQPLVIGEPPPTDDLAGFQPLVLETPRSSGANEGFQPLVVTEELADLNWEIFRDIELLARLLDAEIEVDIGRLSGPRGSASVRSGLNLKSGKLDFGPVTISFGKGFATVRAAMDLAGAPDWLRISGRAGGWRVADVFSSLGINVGASGILDAQFDVTGRYDPPDAFPQTMRGRATVSMEGGRIDSSLIELTGLGVLPWLFSRELHGGSARIVCLRAPLSLNQGRIQVNNAVLETDRVQLVAKGTLDVPGNRIDLRADPRPVGRPLSRSPWPFALTGALNKPQVSVAERRAWRALSPLSMPENRMPCVPDAAQLEIDHMGTGPR